MVFLLLLALTLLNGCAGLLAPARNDETALRRVARWSGNNAGLTQFKGLMQVDIQAQGQSIRGRAAFAGAAPDRLRLEFLSPFGQGLLTVAADGRNIVLIDTRENRVHRLAQTDHALEKFTGVPLSIGQFLDVVTGRPPLPEYAAATEAEGPPGCAVALKSRWHAVLADVRSEGCELPDSMNLFDRQGEVRYSIRWLQWQTVEGLRVPRTIAVSASNGARIRLLIERLWPVDSLDPSLFALPDPEKPPRDSSP